MQLKEKIKDQIAENPDVLEFLNNACIDDLLVMRNVLKLLRSDEGGLSIDDYNIIRDCLRELEEEPCLDHS